MTLVDRGGQWGKDVVMVSLTRVHAVNSKTFAHV